MSGNIFKKIQGVSEIFIKNFQKIYIEYYKYYKDRVIGMQVNLRDDVYERGRKMLEYGDSWSALFERLLNSYEKNAELDKQWPRCYEAGCIERRLVY